MRHIFMLLVRQLLHCGCWGGSCTATPGRQYNCRPNWIHIIRLGGLLAGLIVLGMSSAVAAEQAADYRFFKHLNREPTQAEEIAFFTPDAEIYAATRDGLPDMRIRDDIGTETPYHIESDIERSEQRIRHTMETMIQSLTEEGKNIEIRLILAKNAPPAEGFQFLTQLRDFEHKVRVAGSNDGETWTPLAVEGMIFDYSRYMDVSNKDVALPANNFRQFKISIDNTADDRQSPYKELTRTMRAGQEAEQVERTAVETRPLRIDRIDMIYYVVHDRMERAKKADYQTEKFQAAQDADAKQTIIEIDAKRAPLTSFTLETSSRNFSRRASVQVQSVIPGRSHLQPDRIQWQEIGIATISNLQLQNFQRQQLAISFPEHRETKYRIVIDNEDNPPLEVTGIKAKGNVYRVTFLAQKDKSYRVLYGSEDAQSPKYETAAVLAALRKGFQPVEVKLGPQTENKAFAAQPDVTIRKLLGNWYFLGTAIALMVATLGWGLYRAGQRLEKLPDE
jgi:hypothetical protein